LFGVSESKADPTPDRAMEIRLGVEEKSWIARVKQAKQYSERAQMVLDTVQVGDTISPNSEKD
jgi:hypothetical protein